MFTMEKWYVRWNENEYTQQMVGVYCLLFITLSLWLSLQLYLFFRFCGMLGVSYENYAIQFTVCFFFHSIINFLCTELFHLMKLAHSQTIQLDKLRMQPSLNKQQFFAARLHINVSNTSSKNGTRTSIRTYAFINTNSIIIFVFLGGKQKNVISSPRLQHVFGIQLLS